MSEGDSPAQAATASAGSSGPSERGCEGRDGRPRDGAGPVAPDPHLHEAGGLLEQHHAVPVPSGLGEDVGRAHVRMPREGHLVGAVEDAHVRGVAGIPRGQHERGLAVVELRGERLHLGVAQPLGLQDDGERVPPKRRSVKTSTVTNG
jgi:hypothetical protein